MLAGFHVLIPLTMREVEVAAVLRAIASIADPKKDNGWVVMTSRYGSPVLLEGMKPTQNVALKPLSEEDATSLLRRYQKYVQTSDANDSTVSAETNSLKNENVAEYNSIRQLC